jgi:formate dehydrogenase subunit gamma
MVESGRRVEWDPELVRAVAARHEGLEGPLLPILHDVQAAFGCVPREAVPVIAEALNLSRAEVHGTISFYHDFRDEPAGRRLVKVCRGEACQSKGGAAVAEAVQRRLGVGWGETTADGAVTLEPVYCLGLCAVAPAALVDDDPIGRLDADRLCAALAP